MTRPNILVLMADQHRADILGCAGDPVVRTPNIDALAAAGTRFSNMHCQGPLCMPARASFLTERYVRDHGLHSNDADVPTELPTFLHELRAVGYHTACIGKMHLWLHGRRGSDRSSYTGDTRERVERLHDHGFVETIETVGKLATVGIASEYTDHLESRGLLETYREWVAERLYSHQRGADTLPNWSTGSIPIPTDSYVDAWHGDRVVQWLDEHDGDDPWCMWVGFPGPHDPWDAPADYVDLYRDIAMPMPATLERPEIPDEGPFKSFLDFFVWHHSDSRTFTDDRIQEVRRAYYANVTVIDDAVGRIVAALERSGQADNTWIIYTSDHGEMMGEHRMLMKMVFYEPSVKVPCIVRPPGGSDARTIPTLAEHVDLSATLRAIGGAGGHETFEGRSLLGHLDGEGGGFVRDAVWSENYGFASVRTDRHKLVVHETSLEAGQLFDLEEDPDENHNVVRDPAHADVVEELMETEVRPFFAGGRVNLGPELFT